MKCVSFLGKIGSFFLGILLLSSCAPTSMFVRTGPSFAKLMPQVRSIAVIDDACVLIEPFGVDNDYVSVEDTKLAESLILESAKTYLEQKGYQVNVQLSPFVCGFVTPDKPFRAAERRGAKISDRFAPFLISEPIDDKEEYKQALLNAIRRIRASFGESSPTGENSQITSEVTVIFSEDTLRSFKIISAETNSETVFFIIGHGGIVPTGRTIAQGLITGVLSFGMLSIWPLSALDTYAVLIDLKNGEMLWANSLRVEMNPANREAYTELWPSKILYHFPSRTN